VKYPMQVKTARLRAVLERMGLEGAMLEVGTAGMTTILARIPLANPPAEVSEDTLQLLGLPAEARAIADGAPEEARIVNAAGDLVVEELARGVDYEMEAETLKVGKTARLNSLAIIHP
jgi:hypothetical protein